MKEERTFSLTTSPDPCELEANPPCERSGVGPPGFAWEVLEFLALLNRRAYHGALDCFFSGWAKGGQRSAEALPLAHPQGGGFLASPRDPEMASHTQAGELGHRAPPGPSSFPHVQQSSLESSSVLEIQPHRRLLQAGF